MLPENLQSLATKKTLVEINDPGNWLIINDIHIPHHDNNAVETALKEAKRRKVVGIIINGDLLDSAEISTHERHKSGEKYCKEILMGKEFLKHVRKQFRSARIVFKLGNHEERFDSYVLNHAPALLGLSGFDVQSLLGTSDYKIEHVADKKLIKLGKLYVLHGHEFGNGGSGVNVASWLLRKSGGGVASCCGHFHRTDSAGARNLGDFQSAAWSIGCACDLSPFWLSQNQWNHGFAIVELEKGGDFHFNNYRVFPGGRIY